MLETLGPFPIDTAAPIVLTGALPLLILLQALEMAAQCISWTLGPWGGPWYGDLLVPTFGYFRINITWYYSFRILLNFTKIHNITQYTDITPYYWYHSILLMLLNITHITQYYPYYSILPILHANVILKCSSFDPGYYPNVTNIMQHHQYYTILQYIHQYNPILHFQYSLMVFLLSILLNITNITQYYLFSITQYS